MFKIRPFQPTDAEYDGIAQIEKAVYPENAETAADFKHSDTIRKPEQFYRRWIVEQDGRLIAFANTSQQFDSNEPDRYRFNIVVHPDFERIGVGTAVYNHIWQTLQSCDPRPAILETTCYQHHPQTVRFLQKRGFQQVMRWVISKLDVPAFDTSAFTPLRQKLEAQGIAFCTVPELQASDPEWLPKLHELDWQLVQDEPLPFTPKKMSEERFRQLYLEAPTALVDSWVVAVENGRYVGNSMLEKGSQPGIVSTGFTGVLRDYRRCGLATALKAHANAYALAAGFQAIRTGNEENNPMLTLNKKLGFKEITASLAFEKRLETP
jgi:GNAT superfamily N-acetyltransferase